MKNFRDCAAIALLAAGHRDPALAIKTADALADAACEAWGHIRPENDEGWPSMYCERCGAFFGVSVPIEKDKP